MKSPCLSLAVLALLFASGAGAELPHSVSKGPSELRYGVGYEPRQASTLDELPLQVRQRLVRQLQRRLGAALFKELSFEGGEIIDKAALLAVDPAMRDYPGELPAYRANFALRRPDVGVALYVLTLDLRSDGSAMGGIAFPCVSCHPEKSSFVALPDALQSALANGMSAAKLGVAIDYDPGADSLVWIFSQKVSEDRASIRYDRLRIDAHSGAIVGRAVEAVLR
jgi:hypothetical protein